MTVSRSTWLGLMLVAALVAGCSSAAPGPSPQSASPSASSRATAPPPTPLEEGPISVSHVGTYTVSDAQVGLPSVFGDYVALTAAPLGAGDAWDRVVVIDTHDGTQRTVAHTGWSHGLINWAVGTGHWVAWVDQSREQSDTEGDVLWRIWAKDLRTGRRRLLASNGDDPDPYVPPVKAGDGYVFWAQAEADRSAHELAWRPGDREPQTLLRHAVLGPGSESAAGGRLVYVGGPAPQANHRARGDCWSVPLAGGAPTPVTHTGLVMGCAVSGTHLVWTEHIDPQAKPLPEDGILDDPYEIWTEPLDGSAKHRLHRGYLSMGDPLAGRGYAAWPEAGAVLLVHDLRSPVTAHVGPGQSAVWSSAGGDLAAYVTGSGKHAKLQVDRVSVEGADSR